MNEDVRYGVTADTSKAEKQLDDLEKKHGSMKVDVDVNTEKVRKANTELNGVAETLGKAKAVAQQIQIAPNAFSRSDLAQVQMMIRKTAQEAKRINMQTGIESAKELENQLKSVNKEITKAAQEGKKTSVGGANEGIAKLQGAFKGLTITAGLLAHDMLIGVVNGLQQAVTQGMALNSQLEFANAKIRTISNAGAGEIQAQIERMSLKTGVSMGELSEGLYQVVSAIGDVSDKYKLLEVSQKLALTGFSSVNGAIDGLTTVLNAYNLSIDQSSHIAEVFVKTQKVGKLTVQEFQAQLYRTVPVAKELGIKIEEIGASIALLTSKGTRAAVAQTQMSAFLAELQSTTSKISQEFQKLKGMSVQSFLADGGQLGDVIKTLKGGGSDISAMIGSKTARNFYLNMSSGMEQYQSKLKEISTDTGELENNVNSLMDTMESRNARSQAAWDSLKNSIGEVANSVTSYISDAITGYDRELGARANLNVAMEKNLTTLRDLGDQSNLTKAEQDDLNNAIDQLSMTAPDVYAAYMQYKAGALEYSSVLALIHQQQLQVINDNFAVGYAQAKVQNEKDKQAYRENYIKKAKKYNIQTREQGDISEGFGLEGGFSTEEIEKRVKEAEANGAFNKLSETERAEMSSLTGTIKSLKNNIDTFEKNTDDMIKRQEKAIKLEGEKNNAAQNNAAQNKINRDDDLNTTDFKQQEAIKQAKQKTADDIKKEGKQKELDLKSNYNAQKEKALQSGDKQAYSKIQQKESYELKSTSLDTKLQANSAEIEKLNNSIKNESGNTEVSKASIEKVKKELETKKAEQLALKQEKTDLDQSYKYSQLADKKGGGGGKSRGVDHTASDQRRKEQEEKKAAEERFKESELKLTTKYAEKENEIKLKYFELITKALEEGSLKKVEELNKQKNEELNSLSYSKKIDVEQNKINNKPNLTKAEKNSILVNKKQLEVEQKTQEQTKKAAEIQEKLNTTMENLTNGLDNMAQMFYSMSSSDTGNNAMNTIGSVVDVGSTIFKGLKGFGVFDNFLTGGSGAGNVVSAIADTLGNVTKGSKVGSTITGILGGGTSGNIGTTVGSVAGGLLGGGVGSVVGGALGSIAGSIFGGFGSKKKKKEKKKYEKAQKRLEESQKEFEAYWVDYMDSYSEALEKSGAQRYINTFDQLQGKTNKASVYNALSSNYQENKGSAYGVSMDTLRSLMPQYNDQEIMDWFKSNTGGAELVNGMLQTGQGKYGLFDLEGLAENLANINSDFANNLKSKIKDIINFTADSIASTVQNGFGEGLENLGDNLEKMVANSLKTAFMNTDIAKGLFNGLSDNVTDMVKQMFKDDANLGVSMDMSSYNTPQEYIQAIKTYMEMSNGKLEEIFSSLGMSLDNLDDSVDTLNNNLSKNQVQGMATNLWKYNAGQSISDEFNATLEVPIYIGTEQIQKQIIKISNDSLSKARRNRFS